MKTFLIWWYKLQARRKYHAHQRAVDRFSCGYHLASQFQSVRKPAIAFNATMSKLALLDENAPQFRLPVSP